MTPDDPARSEGVIFFMTATQILALLDKHTTTGTMPGESWLNRTAFAVELSLIINKPKKATPY